MSPSAFHLSILRTAALLVPETERTDWLAEWRAELWHVQQEHGGSATAFSMGAFRDAFWLWRNGPVLRSPSILRLDLPATPAGIEDSPERSVAVLSSPASCLSLLAALGTLCSVTALLLPAARHGLLYFPFPGNLVLLAPADQRSPAISRQRFEILKTHYAGQITGLAFYAPVRLQVETPHGTRNLSVARTTSDLFRLLNITVVHGRSRGLVLTREAWRRYFDRDPRIPVADVRCSLPAGVEGWLIEDEQEIAALSASIKGFAVGHLRYTSLRDKQFHLVPLEEPSFWYLPSVAILLTLGMMLGVVTCDLPGGRPHRVGPRRGLFLALKILLVFPIIVFGSLDLGSLGSSVSPLVVHIAFFSSLFAARWILADQRQRCPVCLRLLANPVRMGEPSRILLEWHGTELMCLRGHGMLYVPEWPAIWSGRQRWMHLGPSWGRMFPEYGYPVVRNARTSHE